MAQEYPSLTPALRDFIARQHIFFAASAAAGTRINISPRSTREFRVIGDNDVCWLDLTGSGAETSAHLKADGRLTLMFCAFDGPPNILRLYGRGEILHRDSAGFARLLAAGVVERDVGRSLDAPRGVPVGLAVAHEKQSRHRTSLRGRGGRRFARAQPTALSERRAALRRAPAELRWCRR